MMSGECDKAFGKADEADSQSTLVKDGPYGVVRLEVLAAQPHPAHQHRELLGKGGRLEVKPLVELQGSDVKDLVEFLEEGIDTFRLILDTHALDGETGEVDSGEGEIASCNGRLGTETVLVDPGTATHRCDLVDVSFRVFGLPFRILVERCVQIEEVREETACRDLAGELIKVIVGIAGQVRDTTLFLPDLDGEDGGLTVSDTLVRGVQDLTDDTASFGGGVRSVVDG